MSETMKQVDVMALMGALTTKGSARLSDFATPVGEEKPEVSAFGQRYNELKGKHPNTLMLFRVGGFYEAYYGDAEDCARVLDKELTLRSDDGSHVLRFPYGDLDACLPKLVRAGKRIAILDEITINEPKEDKTMRLDLNANKTNESVNVAMQPQVNNPIEDAEAVEVTEVEDIVPPAPKKIEEPKPAPKPEAVTVPLSDHGTMVVGGVPKREQKPEPEKPKRDKSGRFIGKAKGDAKPAAKADLEPDPEAVGELSGMLTKVTLVAYTTKNGDTAPRIVGFSGEDDPRWKPVNDEKKMLVEAYNKARKTDKKAKLQSSPFGPSWLTDRETGEKTWCMTFGVKYMDAAKALCEAYNTTDRMAWHKAEDAVRALKKSIAEGYKAEREARRAGRQTAQTAPAAEPAPKTYTNEDVAAMLRQVLAGGNVPEDIEKLLKAA